MKNTSEGERQRPGERDKWIMEGEIEEEGQKGRVTSY